MECLSQNSGQRDIPSGWLAIDTESEPGARKGAIAARKNYLNPNNPLDLV